MITIPKLTARAIITEKSVIYENVIQIEKIEARNGMSFLVAVTSYPLFF